MGAARHVDDVATALQAAQRGAVHDALCLRGQRQQVDQNAAATQEVIKLLRAMKDLNASD
ncbi:hypothetical protein GALL_440630 [mine drainage metagenome]|uniref:Uncharacterized protein n=1 Tax=mine drainage metagenome TaxID=410659 RepID=A0A1J5Q322_9ZZZZ